MQRVVERVRKAERTLSKKRSKAAEHLRRSEAWERNQTRVRQVKEHTARLREDRKNRAIDWETGALAPRRDVGDKAGKYGALDIPYFQPLDKDPESRLPENKWPFREGDRVVITRGRDQGKIGVISEVDHVKDAVKVKGLNMVDVALPKWMKERQNDKKDYSSTEQMISRKDVQLVYALPDPETGIPRDAIIEKLEVVDGFRVIPGSNTFLPWPEKDELPEEHEEYEDDTLRHAVEERTFRPFLIRPPMPLSVIDELRNKYSRFRTRHEYDYKVQKELEDAKVEERKGLMKTMRTPLQELAEVREKQKAAHQKELTEEQMAKIGEIIAQERARKSEDGVPVPVSSAYS
ncbi:hypothetical protein CKM354_000659700 [Cercospora kikuchii]|uniref:KOW domain-containing protein n=1 Tax=Cercospora kikuchii TaxID=84275 RepID=A0A9P3FGN8_9PEZI|nr:uncharacterized protein CKM354_000659700 [Cercospora kikuchii]GIZ43367.1 hypothetical protein CKM354_000659700 [Cercospora kikuchii]